MWDPTTTPFISISIDHIQIKQATINLINKLYLRIHSALKMKLKYLTHFFILTLMFTLSSCLHEGTGLEWYSSACERQLNKLANLEGLIPVDSLSAHDKVVFQDEFGFKRTFNVFKDEFTIRSNCYENVDVELTIRKIEYKWPTNPIHNMAFETRETTEGVDELLVYFEPNPPGMLINKSLFIIEHDGNCSLCDTVSNLTIIDRDFNAVFFKDLSPTQEEPYSELYYNADYGIVGFRDGNGALWRFDKFTN